MTYQNKFVAVVKANGKVLREQSGAVAIPFGAEYSILLKNLNSVRVLVSVSIDGKVATEGAQLVIEPNSSIELERYIRGGNIDRGNKFKFIERTEEIEDHRGGIQADDGLIRIEYKTEEVVQHVPVQYDYLYHPYYHPYWYPISPYNPTPIWYSTVTTTCEAQSGVQYTACNNSSATAMNTNVAGLLQNSDAGLSANDAGITVPGSESQQKFQSVSSFKTAAHSDVIVLRLRGEIGGKPVVKPVTVNQKIKCSTCGRTSKATSDFCAKCGTSLQLI